MKMKKCFFDTLNEIMGSEDICLDPLGEVFKEFSRALSRSVDSRTRDRRKGLLTRLRNSIKKNQKLFSMPEYKERALSSINVILDTI